MLELQLPLSRVLDGPGLLVRRLTEFMSSIDLRSIDPDYTFLGMAETDPDLLIYLDSEGLLQREGRSSDGKAQS